MSRFLAALWIRVPLVVACSIAACDGSTETGDPAGTLAWGVIPGFVCTVGVPIDRDLRAYLTDPSGVATVTLDRALPDGLDLQNGRIEGTPTTETPSRSYSAIADDGSGTVATSSAFTIRVRLPAVGVHPMLDAIRAMPANSWLELDGTAPDSAPEPSTPQNGPRNMVIDAWGGGVLCPNPDPDEPDRMVLVGGGHNDYSGNEPYALRLDTFVWELLREPTYDSTIVDQLNPGNVTIFPDGTPISRHTYSSVSHDRNGNLIMVPVSGCWSAGGTIADNRMWRFNMDARDWDILAAAPAFDGTMVNGYYQMTAVDEDGAVWMQIQNCNGLNRFAKYVPGAGFTYYNASLASCTDAVGCIDTVRHFFVGHVPNTGSIVIWDLAAQPEDHHNPTESGDTDIIGRGAIGMDFRPADGKCYCWAGTGNRVYRFTPDPSAVAWEEVLGLGDAAPTIQGGEGVGGFTGTYGRWRYWPDEDVFLLVNRWNANAFVYRPPSP